MREMEETRVGPIISDVMMSFITEQHMLKTMTRQCTQMEVLLALIGNFVPNVIKNMLVGNITGKNVEPEVFITLSPSFSGC